MHCCNKVFKCCHQSELSYVTFYYRQRPAAFRRLNMSLLARPMAALLSQMALLLLLQMALSSALRLPRDLSAAEVIANQTGAARQPCQRGAYECVPYYHCDSDDIITDGFGALDIRCVEEAGIGGIGDGEEGFDEDMLG